MWGSDSPVISLPEQFFRAAAALPGRTAVSTAAAEVTYGELAGTALRVAAGLRAGGVGRGDKVGVCLPRDPRLVAALLGVLAAGAAYVPVDHRHVSRRTDRALADAGARVVVDTSTWDALAAAEPLPAPLGVGPDDLAYVLFTSGSTGTPKGVAVEHGALAAMLGWAQEEFGEDEARVSSAVASVGFDFSVLELLLPLSRGGTVLLADDLLALAEHPRFAELTLLNAVPAAAALLLDDPLPRSVRTVAFGGERLSRALADRAHANPGVTRVLNLYGPTENTVVATAAEVPAGSRDQPVIGTAVGGTRTHVVGADGRLGDAGELWLTGTQLARGYVGRPDLTAAAFVELDGERAYRTGDQVRLVDGVLHYVGRDDDQVKVRGVRIELGEVEAALSELAGARRVAAAVVGDRLVGYVDGDLDTGAARGALRDLLPEFLVPDQLVTTELVLGSTGKIDRSALPRPSDRGAADAGGPPRGAAEELVAALVGDLLDLAVLGRDAPLDDAGLHSLAAARLVQRLAEQDGRLLAPGSALAGATVADVARALEAAPRTAAAAAPPPARPGEMVPLTDLQRRMWLQRVLADDPAVTSVGLHLRLDPAPAAEVLRAALLRLTEVHPTLRMAVDDGPTGPRGRWLEPGVLLRGGHRPRRARAGAAGRLRADPAGAPRPRRRPCRPRPGRRPRRARRLGRRRARVRPRPAALRRGRGGAAGGALAARRRRGGLRVRPPARDPPTPPTRWAPARVRAPLRAGARGSAGPPVRTSPRPPTSRRSSPSCTGSPVATTSRSAWWPPAATSRAQPGWSHRCSPCCRCTSPCGATTPSKA